MSTRTLCHILSRVAVFLFNYVYKNRMFTFTSVYWIHQMDSLSYYRLSWLALGGSRYARALL